MRTAARVSGASGEVDRSLSSQAGILRMPHSAVLHGEHPHGRPSTTEEERVRVGILGSGLMGAKLGTIFARAGHEVVFSYARSQQKLQRLAREAGERARVGTP